MGRPTETGRVGKRKKRVVRRVLVHATRCGRGEEGRRVPGGRGRTTARTTKSELRLVKRRDRQINEAGSKLGGRAREAPGADKVVEAGEVGHSGGDNQGGVQGKAMAALQPQSRGNTCDRMGARPGGTRLKRDAERHGKTLLRSARRTVEPQKRRVYGEGGERETKREARP